MAAPRHPATGRYLVFELQPDGFRPLHHRQVTMYGRTSLEAEAFASMLAAAGDDDQVGVELIADSGRVAFRDVIRVPRWVRSEGPLAGTGPELEGAVFAASARPFVVRVPGGPRRLRLRASGRAAEFDLDVLAADTTLPLARFAVPAAVATPLSGSPANRLDLLLLGDGYRAEDAPLFAAKAGQVADQFFGISPYADYRSHANVALVATVSAEAGADHPAYDPSCPSGSPPSCCADPIMEVDPRAGQIVDTALDASFCNFNIHRFLAVNVAKTLAAAAAYPDWDEIIVLVNDLTYGGSGGTVSTISANANAVQVVRHELGHSFSRLADEYETPFPGYPECSDITFPACQRNVTDQTSPSLIKWAPWIGPNVPLPTPETSEFQSVVGLFEGARFRPIGMYRPRLDCLMRALGQPFCEVCRQSFVLMLYDGGWGEPLFGIDPIEPGSETPPPGPVAASFPGRVDFTNALLAPVRGSLSSSWSVDGHPVAGAAGSKFSFTPLAPGTYTVRLDASDPSPFVLPAMAGNSLNTSRVWTVNVAAGGSSVAVAAVEPTSGPAAGGTVVSVRGGGFAPAATVSVGGLPATDVAFVNDRTLTARVPALDAGALYAVAVANPSPASTLPAAWFADFTDVPQADGLHRFVERLVRNAVSGGCGGGFFCRDSVVTRAQMSLFLLRARYGAGYVSPPATGTVFADVPASAFAAAWIEDLAARGVTAGCGNGNFCPDDPVTRAAMSVFLLVAKNGVGYHPPPATGLFADVPASDPFAPWIEELAREGVTAGCGGGNFCPLLAVTRGQMAVFLSVTFALP